MKFMVVCCLVALSAFASAANDHGVCHANVDAICEPNADSVEAVNCNALYSGFAAYEKDPATTNSKLSEFANDLIHISYRYLLLAKHFDNYVKNRPGLVKLYKNLADDTWEKGIEVMKHITTRGGIHRFDTPRTMNVVTDIEVSELSSLSRVLDSEKVLATQAHALHKHYSHVRDAHTYDPEIAHYIEEHFIESQAKRIRTLSGYLNDLKRIVLKDGSDRGSVDNLGIYLFDQYLEKQ